ncbi:MAG: NAD-dependent epimerase/dehydratase family protein [Solirubrobacteraceae bacterium]
MTTLVVAITGSQGYVGRTIAAAVTRAGHDVIALDRRPRPEQEFPWRAYDLAAPVTPALLHGCDVVVHCAYDLSLTRWTDIARVNIAGTARLVAAARPSGVRVCLVSSMSAYSGTRQLYGRAKLASERDVLQSRGDVVRLGLVYGRSGGGMIASLRGIAGLPVIPVIGRSCRQFMVHADDMAGAVVALLEGPTTASGPVGLAHPEAVEFETIIRALAARRGKRPTLISIPWRPVYGAMRAAEAASVKLPLRADSLLGLVAPAPYVPHHDLWSSLGVHIRAFDPASL